MNNSGRGVRRFEQHSIPFLMYCGIALRSALFSLIAFLIAGKVVSTMAGAAAGVVVFVVAFSGFVQSLRPGPLLGSGKLLGWIEVGVDSVSYEWLIEGGKRSGTTRVLWDDVVRFELPVRPMGMLVVHRRDGTSEIHEMPLDGRQSHELRNAVQQLHDTFRRLVDPTRA